MRARMGAGRSKRTSGRGREDISGFKEQREQTDEPRTKGRDRGN